MVKVSQTRIMCSNALTKASVRHGAQKASSRYRVNIFNQHTGSGIGAYGRTRREAFENALTRAGEEYLRYKGDKLTIMRSLFFDVIMAGYNKGRWRVYATSPHGACVELIKLRRSADGTYAENF